jgi:hypothetical protein
MTGVGFATQANTNIKALKAANDYCNKLGKHMVEDIRGIRRIWLVSSTGQSGVHVPGRK